MPSAELIGNGYNKVSKLGGSSNMCRVFVPILMLVQLGLMQKCTLQPMFKRSWTVAINVKNVGMKYA